MMNKTVPLFLAVLFLVTFSTLTAQTADGHEHHHHADHAYEIGLSAGWAQLIEEKEDAFSLHSHIMRRLGEEDMWKHIALGIGAEYIFAEHQHYSVVGTFSINPYAAFIFDISPGILITEHDGETERQFVTHLELTYEFDLHNFGFGPVIGYGLAAEDNHFMIGLHLGKGF